MLRNLVLATLLMAATAVEAGQNVVVVLDDSGSMMESMRSGPGLTKMEAAKGALLTVLDSLPPDAKVGVVRLNGPLGGEWVFPLATVDRNAIRTAIQSVRPIGGTPLGERMKTGADALLALRDQQHYGSYRLLIVTDGQASDEYRVNQYLPDILRRGIWVDVIGVDMEGDHQLATQVHTYRRADDPESLEQAIREVFAESTGGPGDADDSDFEWLAAIPDEVAVAALDALTKSGNYPIGEPPPAAPDAETDLALVDDTAFDAGAALPANMAEDQAERGGGRGHSRGILSFLTNAALACFAVFLLAVGVMAYFVVKTSKRGRK